MSDFSALIKARLNLEGIDSDIKSINEKQVHLNNVKVDTSSIISQIQLIISMLLVLQVQLYQLIQLLNSSQQTYLVQ